MTCGIYLITNNITGKQYVGQSKYIEKRIKQHQYCSDLRTSYLENSIKKYGWENFTYTILCECPEENLDDEERKFINLYGTYNDGYNLTWGGELKGYGNPMYNPVLAKKNGDARRGRVCPKEIKLKVSKTKNKTGFYKVFKENDKKLAQGFCYRYEVKLESGKTKILRSIDINRLEDKVKKNGFDWIIIDEELAAKTVEESYLCNKKWCDNHSTGIFRVIKHKDKTVNQGFCYRYQYYENGKPNYLENVSLLKLRDRVLSKGLDWIRLNGNSDKELCIESLE